MLRGCHGEDVRLGMRGMLGGCEAKECSGWECC